jgi:hypothetical protein
VLYSYVDLFTMYTYILPLAALLALVDAHGVILAAQGEAGSPPSVGFKGESLRSSQE